MEVIPAIDLRGGRCVRLYQGDYSQETVFSDDPLAVALRWQAEGARRLHLVDLDGAREGRPVNSDVIGRIAGAVSIPVQVGGGIRSLKDIEKTLALGVQRVILGTAAVDVPELVAEACRRYGEAVVVGVDAKDGYVAVRGWLEGSALKAADLIQAMAELGAGRFIYTDIARDGTLTEPNFAALAELTARFSLPIIVAGGVARLEHLRRLASLGAEGAIAGKALYTGDLSLREALSMAL